MEGEMKNRIPFNAILLIVLTSSVFATVRNVPSGYSTIQAAINASSSSDTVLVAPGTYFENINFKGKKIVVTSRFYESGDLGYIGSTVIDGSKPVQPDTASCVLMISGEDSSSVLQGFTLTGGTGTRWTDEHGAGVYIEGGGILIASSSPTIRFNRILNNEAIRTKSGVVSAGGGGIRMGDGKPVIVNNTIAFNKGRYGAGVVLNYCGTIFRNNIVAHNVGGEDYGGAGVWINSNGPASKILENNTIVGNLSRLDGGGILVWSTSVTARNLIVWGNSAATTGQQIQMRSGGSVSISYSDIEGGYTGTGNIAVSPQFNDSSLYLLSTSPCIDAGNPDQIYNDTKSKTDSTKAAWPAQGSLRNDLGAYGGPGLADVPPFSQPMFVAEPTVVDFGTVKPGSVQKNIVMRNIGSKRLVLDSCRFASGSSGPLSLSVRFARIIPPLATDTIGVIWAAQTGALKDTMFLSHNVPSLQQPFIIPIHGIGFTSVPVPRGIFFAASGSADTGKIYRIDTTNLSVSVVGVSGYQQVLNLAIHPITREMYCLVSSGIITLGIVNCQAGYVLPIAPIAVSNPKGLTFSADGKLYLANYAGSIFTIGLADAKETEIAATGRTLSGLAFHPVTGELWGSVRTFFGARDEILKISLKTGEVTSVGQTGFGLPTVDLAFDSKGKLWGFVNSNATSSDLLCIDQTSGVGTSNGQIQVPSLTSLVMLGDSTINAVRQTRIESTTDFNLGQNYPNPFNPLTTISYSLPVQSIVRIRFFNVLGQSIEELAVGTQNAGSYSFQWKAKGATGVCFCLLEAVPIGKIEGSYVKEIRMIVLK
jgi:hypothetical protein